MHIPLPPRPLSRQRTGARGRRRPGRLAGTVVVPVPGHTDGSIALHLPGPRLLVTGDAVADVGRTMLGVVNTDRVRAVESLRHGDPVLRDAVSALRAAAEAEAGGIRS